MALSYQENAGFSSKQLVSGWLFTLKYNPKRTFLVSFHVLGPVNSTKGLFIHLFI